MGDTPLLDLETYARRDDWIDFVKSEKTLADIPYDLSWFVLFSHLEQNPNYAKIIEKIGEEIKENKHTMICPKPGYLFSAFLMTPAHNTKVVIIGQDPYFNAEYCQKNKKRVQQAMGLSFSVPHDFNIPSSLCNIYRNLHKFGHLKNMPKTGNLSFWASQGCLMLNAALTVRIGEKKSHTKIWKWMTDEIIRYLSTYFKGLVFVLWGGDAYQKINLIDQDRHHLIISSHPSGLSANKPFRTFPSFMDCDHFGKINEYLKKEGKETIMWDL